MAIVEPTLKSINSILGLNLDGERLLLVYGGPSGMVQERLSVAMPANKSFPAILELITASADRLLMVTQAQRLPLPDCVSVSITGNYDPVSGSLESAPDFPEWKSEPLKSQLGLRLSLFQPHSARQFRAEWDHLPKPGRQSWRHWQAAQPHRARPAPEPPPHLQ